MKVIYYIIAGLILGIVLTSGCIQKEKSSTIINEEIKDEPKQTNIAQTPPGSRLITLVIIPQLRQILQALK